ncbi:serine/threonine protein phosphatase 1 [Parvibaculum sp. MBR-TMA-1.3b-4.2]
MGLKNLVHRIQSALGDSGGTPPSAPEGMRIYAIGDIHGRADLLEGLLARIEKDARDFSGRKVIVFLGDYVDRGMDSRAVLDRLVAGPPTAFEAVYLKGNHEEAMLQFLADAEFGRTWKYYGGLETLHSYGVRDLMRHDSADEFEQAREKLEAELPEAHKKFLQRLETSAEFGDYFFAHAGVRPGVPLSKQIDEDLLWIREDFLLSESSFGKVVVHGHTPEEKAVFRNNRIGVDTGAYMTGVLTALVLEGRSQRLLQTGQDDARRLAVAS